MKTIVYRYGKVAVAYHFDVNDNIKIKVRPRKGAQSNEYDVSDLLSNHE